MIKCKTCTHGIFNEKFGEYKCDISKLNTSVQSIYAAHKIEECGKYEEKKESNEDDKNVLDRSRDA